MLKNEEKKTYKKKTKAQAYQRVMKSQKNQKKDKNIQK